jgi:hypothetical protein
MTNDSNMQTIDAADRWHTDRHTVVVSAAKLVISAARLGSLIDTVRRPLPQQVLEQLEKAVLFPSE